MKQEGELFDNLPDDAPDGRPRETPLPRPDDAPEVAEPEDVFAAEDASGIAETEPAEAEYAAEPEPV